MSIWEIIKQRGLGVREFARVIGVHRMTLYRYRGPGRKWPKWMLVRAAEALGVDWRTLDEAPDTDPRLPIHEWRRVRGISRSELLRRAGISPSIWDHMDRAGTQTWSKVLRVLGVPPEFVAELSRQGDSLGGKLPGASREFSTAGSSKE